MPLWQIYTPVDAYTTEDKKALSAALMSIYVDYAGLPEFYVNVLFHEVAVGNFFIGGRPRDNFVRLVADHIARQLPTAKEQREAMQLIEQKIAPFVKERGYDWEIHVDETPINFWTVHGLMPPPAESEAEKMWARENQATPYEAL